MGQVHESLSKIAAESVPQNAETNDDNYINNHHHGDVETTMQNNSINHAKKKPSSNVKKNHSNKNTELAQREDRAMEQLVAFVVEHGGKPKMVAGFRSRVTRKGATNKYDTNYFNEPGRRFRSMVEVGRFLKIVKSDNHATSTNKSVKRRRIAGTREQEAEKKRIRKELDKLRKTLQRATKNLDDYVTTNSDARYPLDDRILMEEENDETNDIEESSTSSKYANHTAAGASSSSTATVRITRSNCAGARIPDVTGFPGLPEFCTPDVLMTWDFLSTFERALNLSPIALDDFVSALLYTPPKGQMGDDVLVPPVYLAEAHLGLLKLLLSDNYSDDWWWSTLESDTTEGKVVADLDEAMMIDNDKEDSNRPVIKFSIEAALAEVEDPLITASWLSALENITEGDHAKEDVKNAIRTALRVVSNKWIVAYLRKSMDLCKSSGAKLSQRAIRWLVGCVREARPDLGDKSIKQETVFKARAKVVNEVTKQMENMAKSAPAIDDEDAISDFEYEDESDEESDDEEAELMTAQTDRIDTRDKAELPASSIPSKPLPTLTDLLLPPTKPQHDSDYLDAFTWPPMVGASLQRILHRKKRILNEIDDQMRDSHEIPPISVAERRERESLAFSRVLTECAHSEERPSPLEKAVIHLTSGGDYLDLSPIQRLCVLRLLIEASYDTTTVYQLVDGNYKQRVSAEKALDIEKRRAKREAKEKAAADEAAAREQLAAEIREKFIDEKREEIRKLNQRSQEFPDEVIESLTVEDIIDFDDDIKADYEALPGPESFSKSEVTRMVTKLQEEAAFDTDALRVLSLDELIEKEKRELEEMEAQFEGLGGENALLDESLDRETVRSIDRLQKDISRLRSQLETLPELRRKALEQIEDAMEDGTIKVLKAAYNSAKKAKLFGTDDETGGIWAVDKIRDAALELEIAKQNKRLLDAQKDLVAKRNKCFIRSEPMGRDRFGNRFWEFSKRDDLPRVWVETELTLRHDRNNDSKVIPGFLDLGRDPDSIAIGAPDMEEDFLPSGEAIARLFSRQEYHSSGFSPTIVKHYWGCHTTEESLRAMIRSLDSRGVRENELKSRLKEELEETVGSGDKQDTKDSTTNVDVDDEDHETDGDRVRTDGDETVFLSAKYTSAESEDVSSTALENLSSAIGTNVRVRQVVDESKDHPIARYVNGTVTGWKMRKDRVQISMENGDATEIDEERDGHNFEQIPVWRVFTERGHIFWLTGIEVMQSISRCQQWNQGQGYFENDAAFFAYRNTVGRHCGRATEAPYASSPFYFAKLMVKKEGELYPKLKIRSYDNSWGGQSGARAMWTNSMKDYAYDFQTVKQGLLTLETAFFELTGEFSEYENASDPPDDVKAFLDDPAARLDIELESIEKIPGLWNSPTSRAVYHHIVSEAKTTGFLALALDLLVRNTIKFLHTHKLLNAASDVDSGAVVSGRRTTRRMNAWQQQQQQLVEGNWF